MKETKVGRKELRQQETKEANNQVTAVGI